MNAPQTASRWRPAGSVATTPLPKPLFYTLMITLVMFILANSVQISVTAIINATKWAPLALLGLVTVAMLQRRRVPEPPPLMLLMIVMFIAMTSIGSIVVNWTGYGGLFALVTIVVVIATGYGVAALLVATNSRRAFFDLVASISRVIVVASFLFYVARINLGRGGGFAAWVDNPNTLAAILAPGLVVFVAGCIERRPGWKKRHLFFLLLALPVFWASNGRASNIWFLLSCCAFCLYRRASWPTALAVMAGLIVLIGWWEPISGSVAHYLRLDIDPRLTTGIGPLSGREEVWRIGMDLFRDRPMMGYGISSSKDMIQSFGWRLVRFQGSNFHSSYVMLLVETGLIGFVFFVTAMILTVTRGMADSKAKRMLPRHSWPTAALPFVMVVGALGHAFFEAWLAAAGNVNSPLLWICVWLVHFQAQIPVRAVRRRRMPRPPARPAELLPAR